VDVGGVGWGEEHSPKWQEGPVYQGHSGSYSDKSCKLFFLKKKIYLNISENLSVRHGTNLTDAGDAYGCGRDVGLASLIAFCYRTSFSMPCCIHFLVFSIGLRYLTIG